VSLARPVLTREQQDFVDWWHRIDSEDGNPPTPIEDILSRQSLTASIETEEFYNHAHDAKGRFSENEADVRNFGLEDWDPSRRNTVIDTISVLQQQYGVKPTVNAKDTDTNIATQVEALAAVDPAAPMLIDIHPQMKSQQWLNDNAPEDVTICGTDLSQILTHEYGHILEMQLAAKDPKAHDELFRPFKEAQDSYESLVFGTKDQGDQGKAYLELTKTVSEYAGEDVAEGVAEAFLQHQLGVQNKYSDHVGRIFYNAFRG
jgi:hypothetical protein